MAAGRRGTHLAAAAALGRRGVSNTLQGAKEVGGEGLKESALASGMLSCLEMEDRDARSLWQGKGTWSLLVPAQAQLTLVQCPDS